MTNETRTHPAPRSRRRIAAVGTVLALLAVLPGNQLPNAYTVQAASPAITGEPAFEGMLSVLTYNVKGAAWPIASGRPADLARIAAELRAMRGQGTHPAVVVLQEAFTDQARRIGREAGYRFVVDGPAAGERNGAAPATARDRLFAAGASWLAGETLGKATGSGLQLLSDYPVVRIRKLAFPDFACAGFDCLANKGALLVTLKLPETGSMVDILTTHLNSRRSAGVSDARSLQAYRRQTELLTAFVNRAHDPSIPLIAAGDFNDGKSAQRRAALKAQLAGWRGAEPYAEALRDLVRRGRAQAAALPGNVDAILRHGVDWQFYSPGKRTELTPIAVRIPFGPDATGRMLSDHIGYTIAFRLTPKEVPAPH